MKRVKSSDRAMTYLRALLHGDSGIGKTTSILTLPADKTLVAISERGALPLRKKEYTLGILDSWQDCRDMIAELRKPNESGPRVLVLDSLTECSELCKSHIVHVDRRALIHERTQGKKDTPTGIYDDLMTMEDWNLYATRMNGFIAACCHLPMHVICTALSLRKENRKTGEQLVTPDLHGRLAFECPAYFDLVMRMESQDVNDDAKKINTRVWRTQYNGEVAAKDASGALDVFEPADWGRLFRKIFGTGTRPDTENVKNTKARKEKTQDESV